MCRSKNRFLAFLSALLILVAGSGIGTAAEIVVHEGESIQAAVDNGGNGSVIILEPGTYKQDVDINDLDDITIKSSTGNSDDVVIDCGDSSINFQYTRNIKLKDITFTCDKNNILGVGGSYSSYNAENCKFINAGFIAGRECDVELTGNTFMNCKYATSVGEWGYITGKDNTFIDCDTFVEYSKEETVDFELKNSIRIRTDSSGKQVTTIIPLINLQYPNGNSEIPVNPEPEQSEDNSTSEQPVETPTETPTDTTSESTVPTTNTTSEEQTTETSTDTSSSGSSGGSSHHSSGSSHSSGGGGTGGSPEDQKNVKSKDTVKVFVPNEKLVCFNFVNDVTVVGSIDFTSKKTMGKITAITEDLKNKSSLVKALPEGEIYKSFNIWVGNAGYGESGNIRNATVEFKVEKLWLEENNIDPGFIVLNKYNEKEKTWTEIPAIVTSEDDKYVHFKADVPGYSSFVIAGKGSSKLAEESTAKQVGGEVRSTNNSTVTKGTQESPGFWSHMLDLLHKFMGN